MSIQVSSWTKKEETKGGRSYYFSVSTRSDVYKWVIYMNFLRVKAIYDSFTNQFGQINLPLDYERNNNTKNKFKNKFKNDSMKNQFTNDKKLFKYDFYKNLRTKIGNMSLKKEEKKSIEIYHDRKKNPRGSVIFNVNLDNQVKLK
jgi:hypothetical protein